MGEVISPKNARHVVSKWRDADNKIETTIIICHRLLPHRMLAITTILDWTKEQKS